MVVVVGGVVLVLPERGVYRVCTFTPTTNQTGLDHRQLARIYTGGGTDHRASIGQITDMMHNTGRTEVERPRGDGTR